MGKIEHHQFKFFRSFMVLVFSCSTYADPDRTTIRSGLIILNVSYWVINVFFDDLYNRKNAFDPGRKNWVCEAEM
jgi:hypothetical protein